MAEKMNGARLFAQLLQASDAKRPAVIDVQSEFAAQAPLPWVPA